MVKIHDLSQRSALILFLAFIIHFAIGQPGTGLPVWTASPEGDSGILVVNWKNIPPTVEALANISPSYRASAFPAVNKCGNAIFHVVHSGQVNVPNNLYIYNTEGNPILNNVSSNGPGLNAKVFDGELQVINVPGSPEEWYIIYAEFMPNNGAPLNNGAYSPARKLYSRVSFKCGIITVLERDIPLTVGGTAFTYTNASATSILPDNPGQLCLYMTRRDLNSDFLSLDRFLLHSNGIVFDKNTGNIPADTWILTIEASPIEVSSDGKRIAINNRDQATNGDAIFIFDATAFDNNPQNYQRIAINDLILQPDNNIVLTAASVNYIANNNPNLRFLINIESKLVELEFSPNGNYLYFTNGGFAGGGLTCTTYLGQINLGPVNNPANYPYDLRLQIQKPPGIIDPYSGGGDPESMHPDTYFPVWFVENLLME